MTSFSLRAILIDFESLLSAFPEPEPEFKQVMMVNGVLLDSESTDHFNTSKNQGVGRPAYDWKSFQAEMASRLLAGTLPAIQKVCVIEMGEWCVREWGKLPSETNLKNNISPFYAALRKSEIK